MQDSPRDFLSATGLTLAEFAQLLRALQAAYANEDPSDRTGEGQARQRRLGGGTTGKCQSWTETRVGMLVSQKTKPLQTLHILPCALRPSQTHAWLPQVLPVLHHALAALGMQPARQAREVATSPLARAGDPALAMAGPARRRQRPTDPVKPKEPDSGTQKTQTATPRLLGNERSSQVVWRGPTVAGTMHAQQATAEAQPGSPGYATLAKDPGFQGDEPGGVLTPQPKKPLKAGTCGSASRASPASSPVHAWWSNTGSPGSKGVGWSKRCGV